MNEEKSKVSNSFSESVVRRAAQYLVQIGRSEDPFSEDNKETIAKLGNVKRHSVYRSDRHWKPLYQDLDTDELIHLIKGYALVEAQDIRYGGSSVSPSMWMVVHLGERDRGRLDDLRNWFEKFSSPVQTDQSIQFNRYILDRL